MKRSLTLLLAAALTAAAFPQSAAAALLRKGQGAPVHAVSLTGPAALPLQTPAASLSAQDAAAQGARLEAEAQPQPAHRLEAEASAPAVQTPNAGAAAALETAKSAAGSADGSRPAADGTVVFDHGSKPDAVVIDAPGLTRLAARALFNKSGLSRYPLGAKLGVKLNAPVPPNPNKDQYGGPLQVKLSYKEQAAAGMMAGLRMAGAAGVASFLLAFVSDGWALKFPGLATSLGNVSLMTSYGPAQIVEALTTDPVSFLLLKLPLTVLTEEVLFRGVIFGAVFWLMHKLFKRAPESMAAGFKRADLDPVMSVVPRVLSRVSGAAFAVAAVVSAAMFASAHSMSWGMGLEVMVITAIAGFMLAKVAYATRSPVPPVVAHLTFNLIFIASLFVAGPLATLIWLGPVAYFLAPMLKGMAVRPSVKGFLKKTGAVGIGLMAPVAFLAAVFLLTGILGGWALVAGAAGAAGVLGALALYMDRFGIGMDFLKKAALIAGLILSVGGVANMPLNERGTMERMPVPTATIAPQGKAAERVVMTATQIVEQNLPATFQVIIKNAAGATLGSGSGFIVTPEGFAVTNDHVITQAGIGGKVVVRLHSGHAVEAVVLATDRRRDIAFLQLPAHPEGAWPTVRLGDGKDLKVGDGVVAIGNPFGLDVTVTNGIVSGLGGPRRGGYDIQISAAVNPGNSGGASFNLYGEVIGINTAIFSPTGAFAGIAFVRGVDILKGAIEQYKATGSISPAWLGLVVNRGVPNSPLPGLEITEVDPRSGAAAVGLQAGDRIIRVEGTVLPSEAAKSLSILGRTLVTKKQGDKVAIVVRRGTENVSVHVELGRELSKPAAGMSLPSLPGRPDPRATPIPPEDDAHGHEH